MTTLSHSFMAASLSHCRWLPCPGASGPDFADLPLVLAGWSQETQQHILTVGAVRQHSTTHEMLQFIPKPPTFRHPGSVTDLQVARIHDSILVATSSSSGGICLLMMQLPSIPGSTCADLQFVAAADASDIGADAEEEHQGSICLQELPHLHEAAISSVDINATRQSLLSVAQDGSICIVPLDAVAQADGDECHFKEASSWSGYSQGRWVDSQTFATTGVLGGLQVWDVRRGPQPVNSSALSWGHTGVAELDKQQGPARQLLCLDVHPSRPNLAATGASGGSVALWDLRFAAAPLALAKHPQAAGDVWEVKFDPCEPLASGSTASGSAVPALLYITADGALCCTTTSQQCSSSSSVAAVGSSGGALVSQVLARESCSINSFDAEVTVGQDILGVTDHECMLLLHRTNS